MAWRFPEHILRGELDNTVRGRVTGRIWLAGLAEPMTLDLRGDCAPDLAGCTLAFENPQPIPMAGDPPSLDQRGWVGDITASQKVKVHDVPMEEVMRLYELRLPAPWHWANALYLEWFSERNGRVVIQTAEFKLTLSTPAWTLTPEEYGTSREASGSEYIEWLKKNFGPLTGKAQVMNVHELLAGMQSDDEEWTHADDELDDMEEEETPDFDPDEDAEWMPARAILGKYGFPPLRPEEVGDEGLRGRLWELIYALAARRIYLNSTDHLDDRTLYAWLDTFLDKDCADCPLEARSNCDVDVSDFAHGGDEAVQTWLRFFATEKERSIWQHSFSGGPPPPRERPPYDRDRFLPEPPLPPPPPPEWTLPLDDDEEPPFGDSKLADVDREIRIEKLKNEIAEAAGGEMQQASSDDLPPAIEEAFLAQVRDLERDGWQRPIDDLATHGATPLPPEELTDETLTAKLWELLHNLACRGFYVLHTDHLSDRALYEVLWKKGLREEAILPGRSRTGGYFYDTIGSYGPEDMAVFHRSYESEDSRAKHLAEYPNEKIPARETPPFSRDWRLPNGPF
jgi:hypothetical protein